MTKPFKPALILFAAITAACSSLEPSTSPAKVPDNLKAGQAEQLGENANVSMVKVDKAFTGKGVGRALYQAFEKKHGGRIMPSGKTEPSAWKVWKRHYPEKVDAFVEQEVARVRDGAEAPLVVRNITDPEVRARVAAGIDKLKKPKP